MSDLNAPEMASVPMSDNEIEAQAQFEAKHPGGLRYIPHNQAQTSPEDRAKIKARAAEITATGDFKAELRIAYHRGGKFVAGVDMDASVLQHPEAIRNSIIGASVTQLKKSVSA